MKRARLSYDNWTCITDRQVTVKQVKDATFTGHVVLMDILHVSGPQTWQVDGLTWTVCQDGVKWLCMLPEEGGYCMTAMLDEKNNVVLWYIDMIDDQGVDPDGIPWFHDLYLDLVVLPNGYVMVDDRDELDEALASGDVTKAQHGRALQTGRMLLDGLAGDIPALKAVTAHALQLMQAGNDAAAIE